MHGERESAMHVAFRCPFCNCKVKAPQAWVGHRGRCPQCRRIVRVQVPSRVLPDRMLTSPGEGGVLYLPLSSPPPRRPDATGHAGDVLGMLAVVCGMISAGICMLAPEIDGLLGTGNERAQGLVVVVGSGVVCTICILALGLARALNVIHGQLLGNSPLQGDPLIRSCGVGRGTSACARNGDHPARTAWKRL